MNNRSIQPDHILTSVQLHRQSIDFHRSTFETILVHKQEATQRSIGISDIADELFGQDKFIQHLLMVLDQNFGQASFTVEKLAERMAVCPRTLHRKIMAITTLNPTKLIRLYRLIRAIDLLKQGCLVSDAARAVGFDNLSYFTKCFSKEFKVSPSRYIETINRT